MSESWSCTLPGRALAPLVHWDGVGFVLCNYKSGGQLVAVDLADGRILAKKIISAANRQVIHCWNRHVLLAVNGDQMMSYKLIGKTFVKSWKCTLPGMPKWPGQGRTKSKKKVERAHPPEITVVGNEVFTVRKGRLARLLVGSGKPNWTYPSAKQKQFYLCIGTPTVYGPDVFVLGGAVGRLVMLRLDRERGTVNGTWNVLSRRSRNRFASVLTRRGSIHVTGEEILVASPYPLPTTSGRNATHAFLPAEPTGERGLVSGLFSFLGHPGIYRGGFVVMERGAKSWLWWKGGGGRVLAERKYTPELLSNVVSPTVLGDVVYFETWSADIETGEILWKLPVESAVFGAVPGDRAVYVLEREGAVLRGFTEQDLQ